MNNLLQFLLGLVIAALITILAAPYFIDWNQYKSEIEAQASKLVGRQLTVAGDVNLRLLPAPYLQLANITVTTSKAEADKSPDTPVLLTAKAFRLWLSAPPLLRGVIEVREIELVKPHMRFAIDENGKSNWTKQQQTRAPLPFTPTAISLQNMTIEDGTLEISSKQSGKKASTNRTLFINALNGDFSAGSLKGPYKFDGTIGKGLGRQVLRVSAGSIDEKSQMRVKGILRSHKGGRRYAFDGSVLDLKNHPTINGVISAAFPFFKATKVKNDEGDKGDDTSPGINWAKPIEVKTSINANSNGALFDKILVTIVHKNRPQALTGKGRISWDNAKVKLDGNLNARLIDVDHLRDGLKVGNSVEETVSNLFAALREQAANIDSGRFHININQIKLNGDLVQDLKINLEQSGSGLQIKKLFANLPGDNMIEIHGGFEGQSKTSEFKGHGVLRGQSLGHLVTWSAGTKIDGGISAIRSHPFTLRGDLLFGENIWALNHVNGDIAGTSFTGEISHRSNETAAKTQGKPTRGTIDLKLTTSEINSTALVGRPVAMGEIIKSLLTVKPDKGASSPSDAKSDIDVSSFGDLIKNNALKLQLRAGRLRLDDFDGRDLVVDVYFGLKRLQINQLSLRSKKGLRLQADGTIVDLEKNPSGALTATINIEDEEELGQILSWFGNSKTSLFSKNQIASLTPLRLATMLQTASETRDEANIRINGIAGSSHVAVNNRIVGQLLFSRTEQRNIKQMELSGTITNKNGRLLLTQLVPYLPIDQTQLQEIGSGKVWFSAAGLPEFGLNSRVEFNSERVTAGLNGFLGWQQGQGSFNGSTYLKTKDIASGLALMGIDTSETQMAGVLDLTATLNKRGGNYDFIGIAGSVSSSDVEGRATLDIDSAGKKLDLVLLTSSLDVSSLFSPLLEKSIHREATNGTENRGTMTAAGHLASNVQDAVGTYEDLQKPVMTSRRFTSDLLKNIEAQILITADELFLADKIMLENGELSATINKRHISISNIGGGLWGGQMQGKGELDLSSTLKQVSGELALDNVLVEQAPLMVDKSPILNGKASLKMKFSGRGISPAGLFALMNGTGNIKLANAKINHYSSSVLTDIVDDQLSVWKLSEDQTPFKERFKRHLLHADFNLPFLAAKFTIKDGTLVLKTAQKSKNNSKLDLDASLTLASMITHSRLRISALKNAKYANIPSASVVYEGSLAQLDKITPRIDTASLEQHLKVMKMEHDVDMLEKLHRRDDEFAQKAAERRAAYKRKREAERLAQEQLDFLNKDANPSGDPDIPVLAPASDPEHATEPTPAPASRKRKSWIPFAPEIGGN